MSRSAGLVDPSAPCTLYAGMFSNVVYSQGKVIGVRPVNAQAQCDCTSQSSIGVSLTPWPSPSISGARPSGPSSPSHNVWRNPRRLGVEDSLRKGPSRSASLPAVGGGAMKLWPRAAPMGVINSPELKRSTSEHRTASEPGALPSYMRSTGSAYPGRTRDRQEAMLLPYTPNLFCNWSAVGEAKIAALLATLADVWGQDDSGLGIPGRFFDLGCGDGRVVLEVCKAFPERHGVGIDLNPSLVEWAHSRAKLRNLQDRSEFHVGDFADALLDDAAAVFMFLPRPGVNFILKHVFPKCGIRVGTALFSADGSLPPCVNGSYERLSSSSAWTEKEGLYCYKWLGLKTNEAAEK